MREVQTGVWHWEALHPDWKPREEWGPEVSSYAIDDGEQLFLLDPLAPPSEIDELATGREARAAGRGGASRRTGRRPIEPPSNALASDARGTVR